MKMKVHNKMTWKLVKDRLPTTVPGTQVDVYFGSSHWATGIRGMFTYYGKEVVEHGEPEYVWSEYDQQNDKFYEWKSEEPTHYFVIFDIPEELDKEYWLVTVESFFDESRKRSLLVIDKNPVDWLNSYDRHIILLNQMRITKEQHDRMEKKGH